ncbi:uncharacterized protein LOC133520753 [Cydia pomonella]|uniref:uncharacterized protein LOC133520753 n=1 Tax=Cydia pomonella TaxID=82600 RepID=UPI002ADDD48A|nr:uncharacterized protein LOC133520753 [Cydia pomonella]
MATCAGCFNNLSDARFLNCHNCQKSYCLLCTNCSDDFYNSMGPAQKYSWKCVECKSSEPRLDNTNTPVRGDSHNVTMHRGAAHPRGAGTRELDSSVMEVSYTDSQGLNDTTRYGALLDTTSTSGNDIQQLVMEFRLFREEMRAISYEIKALRMTMTDLTSKIKECDGRIDNLCTRVEKLENNTSNSNESHNSEKSLLDTIVQLRMDINNRDQDLLLNDLEISSVPEQNGENTVHIVTTLGQKLGVTLSEHDIVDATRVGRATQLNEGDQGPPSRPRPLVVRLARRALRDQLLHAARVRRGATTEGTGLPGHNCRFYVNERLTPFNRKLFQKARQLKEHYGWRYVWTRDGRIYVRQRPGSESPRHRIQTELDLSRVFGTLDI